jgi:hypothetical protein
MSTLAERKATLLLLTMPDRVRRKLLSDLPRTSARTIRGLLREMAAMPWPVAELASDVLSECDQEVVLAPTYAPERFVGLSSKMPTVWFARLLAASADIDRTSCFARMEAATSCEVRREYERIGILPAKIAAALATEAAALIGSKEQD